MGTDIIITVIVASVAAVLAVALYRPPGEPRHTSIRTGAIYIRELLEGHDDVFLEQMRMHKHVFLALEHGLTMSGLRDGRDVSVAEQLGIFMTIVGHGSSNRDAQRLWQRSGQTISMCLHAVMRAIMRKGGIYEQYVKFEANPDDAAKFARGRFRHFKGAMGAMDGTHIAACVPQADAPRFRSYKIGLSQNVLGVCNFAMEFLYMLAGYEGTGHDSAVLDKAIEVDGFPVPRGKFLLADAAYPLSFWILTPYRNVRYHLQEWSYAFKHNLEPQNKEELFNLRHASLRNVIERTFGVFKKRFHILKDMREYPFKTQVKIVYCCAAINNFLVRHGHEDEFTIEWDRQFRAAQERAGRSHNDPHRADRDEEVVSAEVTALERQAAQKWRDDIARKMWRDYQREKRQQRQEDREDVQGQP